ncbi:MAG: enoyl-CoA hydratase-related protein [Bacteroidia bacterium]|nr:enoyl-CoA hydratase-related protein [Bacteroidia bacterium]
MSQLYQLIEYEVTNRVAYITLNRADKRNALNDLMTVELRDAFTAAQLDDHAKVIVLRANGPVFCAGADLEYLKKLQSYSLEENQADSASLAQLFLAIYRSPKLVIAQVEGHAVAGGCGLVTVCDFAFSVPEAQFGYTEVRIGFVPAIVMTFLLRKLGETRGKEMMLSGDLIDADRAERYNLINRIVPPEEIRSYVTEFAQRICRQNSASSLALTKKMIADMPDFPLENGIKFAAKMNAHGRMTEDCQRGIQAFLNKEKISW